MEYFTVTLKNEKLRLYHRITWLIIGINTTLFLYLAIVSAYGRKSFIATLVTLGICFLLKQYLRNSKYAFGSYPFFLFIILGWVSVEQYWIAAINFLFLLLSMIAAKPLILSFSKQAVEYASIFSKKTSWTAINNCLVKDGLLTVDFKNNKLLQQDVQEKDGIIRYREQNPMPERFPSNEQEFNEFCRQQLNK